MGSLEVWVDVSESPRGLCRDFTKGTEDRSPFRYPPGTDRVPHLPLSLGITTSKGSDPQPSNGSRIRGTEVRVLYFDGPWGDRLCPVSTTPVSDP